MRKFAYLSLFFILLLVPFRVSFATVMGVDAYDLIKLENDNDPSTVEDSVVYFLDKDWKRRPFPNRKVYDSWYTDFSDVKELSAEDMAQFTLGAPVVYRPGTRLVKIPSIPKVYAVEPGGVLRWITSEDVAKTLYGNDWNTRVDDVPESFFLTYTEGTPVRLPTWPTGTLVRRSDGAFYLTEGLYKRQVPESAFPSLRLRAENAFDATNEQLDLYQSTSVLSYDDNKYTDTAQDSRVERQAAAQVDFPYTAIGLKAAEPKPLATLRLTVGDPVLVKGLTATIEGPLWIDGAPALDDIAFVDATTGENLFGVTQLQSEPGSTNETVTMTGAWLSPENATTEIELRATLSVFAPIGETFTVSFPRSGVQLYDGLNSEEERAFAWPNDFDALSAEVEE